MIPLIKINLLPFREIQEQRNKKQFSVLMASAFAAGVLLSAAVFMLLGQLESDREERNALLEHEIRLLDRKLNDIGKLKQQKDFFVSRKNTVETLQQQRFQAAYILDGLDRTVPENTYLTALKAESPDTYLITGHTAADSHIAEFMRALPETDIFAHAELSDIKKTDNRQEFNLKVKLAVPPLSNNENPEADHD